MEPSIIRHGQEAVRLATSVVVRVHDVILEVI